MVRLVAAVLLVVVVDAAEVSLDGLGAVRGSDDGVARNKQTFHQFLGIPYAEPPTGENRLVTIFNGNMQFTLFSSGLRIQQQ